MSSIKKVKRLFAQSDVTVSNKVDNRIIDDALTVLGESKKSRPIRPEYGIWITIMKNPTMRIAAAVVIIGVILGIHYFEISSEFNQAAWGQMLESMKKMPWVHMSKKIEPPILYDAIECWICFDPSIKVYKYSDGTIRYCDYDKGEGYYYKPEDKTITVSSISEKYNVPGPKSSFEIVAEFLERTDELEADISHKYSKVNDEQVEIIESEYVTDLGQCHTLMVRDVEQNLLRSSQTTLKADTNEKIITTTTYNYPENGPHDIYEAGAPRDVEIIDFRPPEDVQWLLSEVQQRYDRGYGDYITMILQSDINEDGIQEPQSIIMFRQQGDLYRMDKYTAGDYEHLVNVYDDIKDDWPELTIEKVQQLEKNEAASHQIIFDGTYTTIRNRMSRDEVTTNRHKVMLPLHHADSINSLAWFEPPITGSSIPSYKVEYELLENDPGHEGLIGLCITKLPAEDTLNMLRKRAEKTKSNLLINELAIMGPEVSYYWLDPSRDYIVIDHIEIKSGKKNTNMTLEAKQTPSGQWYPSHILHEYTYTQPGGEQKVNRIDKRIVLDTKPVFLEGIFQADYMFNAD